MADATPWKQNLRSRECFEALQKTDKIVASYRNACGAPECLANIMAFCVPPAALQKDRKKTVEAPRIDRQNHYGLS